MPTTQHTTGSIAEYLNTRLGAPGVELVGRADLPITHLDRIEQATPGALTFIRSSGFALRWSASRATAALISKGVAASGHDVEHRALLVVPDADLALNEILDLFAPATAVSATGVHPAAFVDASVTLGKSVSIGPHAAVSAGSKIGDGSLIGAGVFIGREVSIGAGCVLHPRVAVLDRCVVSDGCTLHAGVVVGADGFGYRPSPDGRGARKIPHIGNVVIGRGVEIGANSCIDRAKFGSTLIGDGTKIDNLVQIGHGCVIGRCCLIAAQAGLSGSVTVGDGVQIGGQTGVADNLTIAQGTRLAGQTGVISDVGPGDFIGVPPTPVREFFKMHATLKRITERAGRERKSGPAPAAGEGGS